MASDKVILRQAKKAGVDLSAKQYFLVKLTEADTLEVAASGDGAYSLYDNPKENEYGTIAMAGIVKVVCGATIKEGQLVAPNNKGEAQVAVSGQLVVGRALEAGEAGQIIKVQTPTGAKA